MSTRRLLLTVLDDGTATETHAGMRKAIPLIVLLPYGGCTDAEHTCINLVESRTLAPDGRHEVVLFGRDCGATTDISTHISVLAPGGPLSGAGNTFRADGNHGAAPAGVWGGPWTEVQWLASDRLLIRHVAAARVFAQDTDVSGIAVSYEMRGN